VSGVGPLRRERGVAWTGSHDLACWFALRLGLPEPTVLRTEVDPTDVLAYLDQGPFGCKEQEFLVLLPRRLRPSVHTRDRADIEAAAAQWLTERQKD